MKRILVCFAIIVIGVLVVWVYSHAIKNSESPPPLPTTKQITKNHMNISSSAFANQQNIPDTYTCREKGINPPLQFFDIPQNAKSLVLIMDDSDAPIGTFVHWVVYNMPVTVDKIAENSKPTGTEGKNGAGQTAYTGPCPPSGTHHYYFKLYALDTQLQFLDTPDKKAVEDAMQGHVIDQAQLIGLYSK